MVEDVFPVAVAAHVERRDARHPARFVLDHEMLRQPAGILSDRPAIFQGLQEGMGYEGIPVSGAGVPVLSGNGVNVRRNTDGDRFLAVGHGDQSISNTASISTANPIGNAGAPTAKRAWRPLSAKISTMRSDAPFTT